MNMMNTWNLDRTSVIKFSLYPFAIHAHNCKKRSQDLWVLVRELENMAPPGFPDYASFAN